MIDQNKIWWDSTKVINILNGKSWKYGILGCPYIPNNMHGFQPANAPERGDIYKANSPIFINSNLYAIPLMESNDFEQGDFIFIASDEELYKSFHGWILRIAKNIVNNFTYCHPKTSDLPPYSELLHADLSINGIYKIDPIFVKMMGWNMIIDFKDFQTPVYDDAQNIAPEKQCDSNDIQCPICNNIISGSYCGAPFCKVCQIFSPSDGWGKQTGIWLYEDMTLACNENEKCEISDDDIPL